jgi:site-specific recombinase XerC
MSLSVLKNEMHQRLWAAQERWFSLRETGMTKHDIKMAGIRERSNMHYAARRLLFWGATRVDYERVLKSFIDFCHAGGRERNADIDKRDMRDYLDHLVARGASASYLDKVKSAIVKFGGLYGKFESFHAMSRKIAAKLRDRVAAGLTAAPAHQRVTAEVAQRALARLRELDERFEVETGLPRGYHLAAEIQSRCGLRAEEATERLTPDQLADGALVVLGKGGRERRRPVPQDLLHRLRDFFVETGAPRLAPLRAYEAAVRRAVRDVGGRATGTHARRRLWAEAYKNEQYRQYLLQGLQAPAASERALADTLDALGHGRDRRELRVAYLRAS